MNWKELLVNALLPTIEAAEEQAVDDGLNSYFKQHPEIYKAVVPALHKAVNDAQPLFSNSKIVTVLLEGLKIAMEQSAATNGVTL